MHGVVDIIGTRIDCVNTADSIAMVEGFLNEGEFHQIATANTDFLVNAHSDSELSHILGCCSLVTADGMPLVWASRALGNKVPERVTGADLTPRIANLAARMGKSIFLLGAAPGVAERAATHLLLDNPTLHIAGCLSPDITSLDAPDSTVTNEVLQTITAANPDILLVAFGNPKQEKWIYRNSAALCNVGICMGVGATFDFLAGDAQRAPLWMRRNGLEWLHRLAQDPSRLWKRYCRDFWVFGFLFMGQLLMRTISRSRVQQSAASTTDIALTKAEPTNIDNSSTRRTSKSMLKDRGDVISG